MDDRHACDECGDEIRPGAPSGLCQDCWERREDEEGAECS